MPPALPLVADFHHMLKALELSGFKSFAEKTKFSFPPAITVIVGPNGSGKSNVVDAIKWVLGTQSAKSLRGKEMTDVIFNGSGTRQAMNTAEVSLTFDNTQRRLAVDTSAVEITRRVYRSGEGEYLINRQPCRLRDIRDLFAGTGIATDAYSVIEQGKVDVLLQSSPRDRRAIFEEAAGISRFKGKKLEAERRLERVDQNLLRLSDIVDEVESRLRSVRMQAAKARRYREHSNRLRSLRTHVGQTDWRVLSESLAGHQQQLTTLTSQRDERSARLEAVEAEALGLETAIGQWEEKIRGGEAQVNRDRELIVAAEAAIEHERSRCGELDDEIGRHRRQLADMSSRAGDLQQQLCETQRAWEAVRGEHEETRGRLEADERLAGEVATRLRQMQRASGEHREQHVALMRAAAALGKEISAAKSREATAAEVCRRCAEQAEELERKQQAATAELAEARKQLAVVEGELAGCTERVRAGRAELAETRGELARSARVRGELEQRHTAASERAAVLTELERRLEGLGSGVKQVLAKARQADGGPYRHIRGLVADLVHVKVDTASLVEAALGPLAEYVVLAPGQDAVDALIQQSGSLQGRVGLLRVDVTPWSDDPHVPDLEGREGVIGRADRFVQTAPEYVPLIRRLLAHTFFVETLAHAMALADAYPRGLSFVTRQGEVVAGPGCLLLGPQYTATGLISRRSELRALSDEIQELDRQIAAASGEVGGFETRLAEQERDLPELDQEHSRATREASHWRLRTASAEQRSEQLRSQWSLLEREAEAAAAGQQMSLARADEAEQRVAETEQELSGLEAQLQEDAARIDTLSAEYARRQQGLTASQVERAKSEQRLDGLSQRLAQLQRDQDERQRGLTEHRGQLGRCQQRIVEAEQEILRLEGEVALRYLHREEVAAAVGAHRNGREADRAQRSECLTQEQTIRQELRSLEQQIHERELEADRIVHQREALAERMLDDYGIELAGLDEDLDEDARGERQEVEQEIADLRRKLNKIGSVNLEALDELDALETRFNSLSSQYTDLEKAKASLEQIITRINVDSRRLFAATINEVRGHFQALFRKLFGGGHADIVLEEGEGVDILEGGIEIVARPPGKEPRNISLLSGGEKTLTCVAMLLAIFRSRPSPFCVLDEVDAALDEANIERFTAVLTEFLSSTQFLVVTHSKKTMTAANTLYGITMQESGVSKRVSVRFEDVTDNGEILESALANETDALAGSSADHASDDTQAA